MGGRDSDSSSSSSGEEDGDADWRAAINSIATTDFTITITKGSTTKASESVKHINYSTSNTEEDGNNDHINQKPQNLKLYQIKAQKLLEGLLEKSLEMVRGPIPVLDDDNLVDEGGIRLFRQSPLGIVFDHVDEFQQPRKKPRILPGELFDEKSKKFRRQIQSVAVDGIDIMAAAREASQKALSRFEAKVDATKEAAKREEERVAELKRIRGEKWLPSVAREMRVNF
ncbi:PREDICTED: uncharacterized protein LOC104608356 isoform X2 [Nelumbo nucifera]|uniref:Uncharacterized protein LOC104608356 isoform X2 n=1 Tax=Nelumbo nucifera TaxID=4432 RepID=A0A1U8QAT0_NELNU|nr:PREDICTED: uncharacterized protein LOC104608356 isoform X2 [Nelumbo nucifera]